MAAAAKVWTRFTRIRDGRELKFRIEEVPKHKFDGMFDLLFDYFAREEPVHKVTRLTEREESFEEYKMGLRTLSGILDYQIDACYIDDDSDELKVVGTSIMVLTAKNDEDMETKSLASLIQTAEVKKLFELSEIVSNQCDVMDKFSLDKYYDDRGIVVHPNYRGLGVAGELFRARMVICKERGVPMTGAWMTSLGSQKAAAKLGWETVCELDYKGLGEKGGVTFEGVPPSCKLMVVKI